MVHSPLEHTCLSTSFLLREVVGVALQYFADGPDLASKGIGACESYHGEEGIRIVLLLRATWEDTQELGERS
jgi:hypothetical protein